MKMFLQYLATNVPRLAKRSHDRTIKLAWSFIKVPLSPATWLKSPRFTFSPVQPIEVCLPIIPLPAETQKRLSTSAFVPYLQKQVPLQAEDKM